MLDEQTQDILKCLAGETIERAEPYDGGGCIKLVMQSGLSVVVWGTRAFPSMAIQCPRCGQNVHQSYTHPDDPYECSNKYGLACGAMWDTVEDLANEARGHR